MHSSESNVDLELIAALIDGRLNEEDRARAMKLLAESDEALELYAQALREQRETSDIKVVPLATRRSWRRWQVVLPIAAAAALAIIAVPTLRNRGASGLSAREYAAELGRDPRFVNGLPQGWEQRGFAVTRGLGSSREGRGAAESALAFRLGVQSVDLQVALQREDTAAAGRLIDQIRETLNSVSLSAPISDRYTALRSGLANATRADAIDRASAVERELRDHLGSPSFAYGQWVAAAELAARTHEASFFQSAHGMRFVQSMDGLPAQDREMLRSIDARLKQEPIDRALDDVDGMLQRSVQRSGS